MPGKKRILRKGDKVGPGLVRRRDFLKSLAALGGASVIAASAPKMFLASAEAQTAGTAGAQSAQGAAAGPNPNGAPRVSRASGALETVNGWYVQDGKVIWGYVQETQMWGGYRGKPYGWWSDAGHHLCITRKTDETGPLKTEDLDKLTDSMVTYGCPGYYHLPPLWFDRRRDAHNTQRRDDGNVAGPLLEMPWARSDQGQAWDGLPLYDLAKFNSWYFSRLKEFADLCDRKGCILFTELYNQHNLLETQAHYCDFPWRPTNCIQATDLPDTTPAANVFYDTTHPVRRKMHQLYIRHCLDNLADNRNVVFLTSSEYSGPLAFMQFWFDTILDWQRDTGRKAHIGLGATKDVTDAMLQDSRYAPHIGTIDLRRWHYEADGRLAALPGGKEVAGRRLGGSSTPVQTLHQVKEYRRSYPDKAIILSGGDEVNTMAALMGGASMVIRGMRYYPEHPATYDMPLGCTDIMIMYEFIRKHVAEDLPRMRPLDIIGKEAQDKIWCLGEPGKQYLFYMPDGGLVLDIDLSDGPGTYDAKWVGMHNGTIFDAYGGTVEGGGRLRAYAMDWQHWMLWLKRRA